MPLWLKVLLVLGDIRAKGFNLSKVLELGSGVTAILCLVNGFCKVLLCNNEISFPYMTYARFLKYWQAL